MAFINFQKGIKEGELRKEDWQTGMKGENEKKGRKKRMKRGCKGWKYNFPFKCFGSERSNPKFSTLKYSNPNHSTLGKNINMPLGVRVIKFDTVNLRA